MRGRGICSISGCGKFVLARGLCNAHYRMERRHGDPLKRKGLTPGTVRDWLAAHVGHEGGECLVFPFGRSSKGYGSIEIDGFRLAHRWMCHAAHGEPDNKRLMALHSCGKGHDGCVNPNHLYWGTSKQNYADQVKHGVAVIGSRVGLARLSEDNVREIRRIHKSGSAGYKRIAKKFSVDESTVRAIISNKTWRHVSP